VQPGLRHLLGSRHAFPLTALEGSCQLRLRLSYSCSGMHSEATAPRSAVIISPLRDKLYRLGRSWQRPRHPLRALGYRDRPGPLHVATTRCPPGGPRPLDGLPSSFVPARQMTDTLASAVEESDRSLPRPRYPCRRLSSTRRDSALSSPVPSRPPAVPDSTSWRSSSCPHRTTDCGPRLAEHGSAGPPSR